MVWTKKNCIHSNIDFTHFEFKYMHLRFRTWYTLSFCTIGWAEEKSMKPPVIWNSCCINCDNPSHWYYSPKNLDKEHCIYQLSAEAGKFSAASLIVEWFRCAFQEQKILASKKTRCKIPWLKSNLWQWIPRKGIGNSRIFVLKLWSQSHTNHQNLKNHSWPLTSQCRVNHTWVRNIGMRRTSTAEEWRQKCLHSLPWRATNVNL